MPILLVFLLIAACLPVAWFPPVLDPAREVAAGVTGGVVFALLGAAVMLRTWVVRTLRRNPAARPAVVQVYGRLRRILFFVNLGGTFSCVAFFGWGWLTQQELLVFWRGEARLAPFAELAVPLPYFVVLFGCWAIYYDAERAIHRAGFNAHRPFAPRAAYLLHNVRQFALMVCLPVGLIATQQSLGRFLPDTVRSDVYRVATLAAVPVLLLLMPLLIKPLLGLKPMPPGPVRDRFEALGARLNFRCTDFLLWPTHGAAANALIAGLLPRVRYVVFTDRILEEMPPEELDAVFGHEVGHARHGHIWLYAAFLVLSMSVLAAFLLLLIQWVDTSGVLLQEPWGPWVEQNYTWLALPPVLMLGVYMFVVFGLLSRRCERQADVFGCKAVSCGNPACTGHDDDTVFPPGGRCLCPTGIRTFARALERVGLINGFVMLRSEGSGFSLGRWLRGAWAWVRAWQHAPLPQRVAFLHTLLDDPAIERRFQRRLLVFKCALMLTLLATLLALGEVVGWRELFETL